MGLQEMLAAIEWQKTVTTLVLVLTLVVGRHLIVRRFGTLSKLPHETRRRWIVRSRAVLLLAILLALLLVWGTELRAFAVSLLAVAVALVIAGKELILCITGSIVRAAGQFFGVGDRIEVNGVRGYVIDYNLLTTSMLEIGPGKSGQMQTGNLVSIPNSVFLSNSVVNETFMEEYILHVFTVPMKLDDNWQAARDWLREVVLEECAGFVEEAASHVQRLERAHGLDLPSMEPRVTVQIPEPGRVDLVVRIPVKASRRGLVEQKILARFLEKYATFGPSGGPPE